MDMQHVIVNCELCERQSNWSKRCRTEFTYFKRV